MTPEVIKRVQEKIHKNPRGRRTKLPIEHDMSQADKKTAQRT